MAYQSFNQPDHAPLVTRKRPGTKQLLSNLNLSADGFDTWLPGRLVLEDSQAAAAVGQIEVGEPGRRPCAA